MKSIRSYFMAKFYDATMKQSEELCLGRWRSQLLEHVSGDTLEIGTGTGVNLQYYPDTMNRLVLSEPDPNMRRILEQKVQESGRDGVEITCDGAGRLDHADESFDSIVSTLVLCSVDDQAESLREIRRLLRPGGAFYFIEHVVAVNEPGLRKWQRFFEPCWKLFGGNCHLTRDTERAIVAAGLAPQELERTSMLGPPPVVRPTIKGVARKTGA